MKLTRRKFLAASAAVAATVRSRAGDSALLRSTLNSPPVPDAALGQAAARMQSPNDEFQVNEHGQFQNAKCERRMPATSTIEIRSSTFASGIAEPKELLEDTEVVKARM